MKRWLWWALAPSVAMLALIAVAVGAWFATVTALAGGCGQSASAPGDVAGIPSRLMPIYTQAAVRYQLGPDGWAYLASINAQETGFGQDLAVSSAGAIGWMQFEPGTWRQYAQDANHDGSADPNDPWDAIFAAADYLQHSGAPGDWPTAIFAYNHAPWYVTQVSARAQQYITASAGGIAASGGVAPAGTASPVPLLVTDPGAIVAATVYGNRHDDNGLGAYQGESLAGDFAAASPPYAELGGGSDQTASLLGHLAPGTALQITNPVSGQSIVAYKHDFGYGQGARTLQGHRYRIDLWWQTAAAIGLHGSGLVKLSPLGAGALAPSACQSAVNAGGYANPFAHDGASVIPERIDMGVDYTAHGPVDALGSGTVTYAQASGTGWGPFSCTGGHGGAVVYKLESGPDAGRSIYVAEGIIPIVAAGTRVSAGQPLATFTGCIEIGWANGPGPSPRAAALGQDATSHGTSSDPGGDRTACGQQMSDLLSATGAPAGLPEGRPVTGAGC